MRRRHLLLAAATPLLASAAARAQQAPAAASPFANGVELAGIRYPGSLSVAGQTLVLNGAGIRHRFVVKVYTAGLYLAGRASTPEQALSSPGPKRLHVVMLRDIDGNELGRLFTRGMQDNSTREMFGKSIPGTLRLSEMFATKKRLAAGENFSVEWVPGQGTTVLVNGRAQGEPIREPEFFQSLMRIWLGDKPADEVLKEALLGRAPAVANTGQN